MHIDGLIFDLDGVLIDSVPAQIAAWSETFERYGFPFDTDIYRRAVDGRPALDGARAIMSDAPGELMAEAVAFKEAAYWRRVEDGHCRPFGCARRFVARCKADGYPMAVASSSDHARRILDMCGLLSDFECVVGGSDVAHGKPSPAIFLLASAQIGCPPEHVVVFEDSVAGIAAANAGGFFSVGLARDRRVADLAAADRTVLSFDEVDLGQIELGARP